MRSENGHSGVPKGWRECGDFWAQGGRARASGGQAGSWSGDGAQGQEHTYSNWTLYDVSSLIWIAGIKSGSVADRGMA